MQVSHDVKRLRDNLIAGKLILNRMKSPVAISLLVAACLVIVKGHQLRPGQATQTHSCHRVRAVPPELYSPEIMRPNGVNATFYKKYTEAYGIPILGSANVTDDALKRACYTVRVMFAGHSGIRAAFYKQGGRFAIMSATEVTLDIPEHSRKDSMWNWRARGLGASLNLPLTTGAEENVLCYANDRYRPEDIFLHESVHAVDLVGARLVIPGFTAAVNRAFNRAKDTGLWNNTYAITNNLEYIAEGGQSFFDVNREGRPNGSGIHNDINTRAELREYDILLYDLLSQMFPCRNTFLKRCESTREMENRQILRMNCNTENVLYPE